MMDFFHLRSQSTVLKVVVENVDNISKAVIAPQEIVVHHTREMVNRGILEDAIWHHVRHYALEQSVDAKEV